MLTFVGVYVYICMCFIGAVKSFALRGKEPDHKQTKAHSYIFTEMLLSHIISNLFCRNLVLTSVVMVCLLTLFCLSNCTYVHDGLGTLKRFLDKNIPTLGHFYFSCTHEICATVMKFYSYYYLSATMQIFSWSSWGFSLGRQCDVCIFMMFGTFVSYDPELMCFTHTSIYTSVAGYLADVWLIWQNPHTNMTAHILL